MKEFLRWIPTYRHVPDSNTAKPVVVAYSRKEAPAGPCICRHPPFVAPLEPINTVPVADAWPMESVATIEGVDVPTPRLPANVEVPAMLSDCKTPPREKFPPEESVEEAEEPPTRREEEA